MTGATSDSAARPQWLCPSGPGCLAALDGDPRAALLDGALVAHALRFHPCLTLDADPLAPAHLGGVRVLETLAHGLAHSRAPLAQLVSDHPAIDRARSAALSALEARPGCPPGLVAAVVRLTALGADAAPGRELGDPAAASARVATRLGLTEFVVATLATLGLELADAVALGAPEVLARAVRAALNAGHATVTLPHAEPIDRKRLIQLLEVAADARREFSRGPERRGELAIARLAEVRANFGVEVRDAKLAALGEFAAGASHEINNPLAIIRGNAELMLKHETDAERQRQLRTIVLQTTRVHDLLQGTRQFARPPVPRRTVVDIAALVGGVLEHHQLDAARKDVALSVVPPPGVVYVSADCGQVTQAVSHVVKNAWEAAPPGGWVRVSVVPAATEVTLWVDDNGPGPTGDAVPHLFDPFFCGRDAGRGRGLGLSIAWRLARQNGGEVDYAPLSGGPTRFRMTFPRHLESAGLRAAA